MDPTPDPNSVGGGAKEDEASAKAPSEEKDERMKEDLVSLPDLNSGGGGAKEDEASPKVPSKKKDEKKGEDLDQLPPLNLPLTTTLELINLIESILQQDYPCPHQQNLEKPKAMNFPISKITIGEWTSTAVYPDDLKARFYFAKQTLTWEILDDVERRTQVTRPKRKMEIHWVDVLSFTATFHPHDDTGTLQLELGKRPAFFMETNPLERKHTQWKQVDHDFTLNQSASKCRRHTLHFSPGVLQKNLGKIVSSDSFWSKLAKVTFPTLPQSLYFDVPYGNRNNRSRYGQCQTRNKDLFHHHPQGQVGEVNSKVATQFCANNGRQMKSFVQDNGQNKTMNRLPETQVIQPSSQLGKRRSFFSRSQLNNPMIQDERQTRNTGELRGSQALPETGRGKLAEEGETQNMEHTHLDCNSQTGSSDSVPPDL